MQDTKNGREVKPAPAPAAGAGAATDIKVDSFPVVDYICKFFKAVEGRSLAEIDHMLKVAAPTQRNAMFAGYAHAKSALAKLRGVSVIATANTDPSFGYRATSFVPLPAPLPLVATKNGREVKPVPAAGAGAATATDIKVDSLPVVDYICEFFKAVEGRSLVGIDHDMLNFDTSEQMDAMLAGYAYAKSALAGLRGVMAIAAAKAVPSSSYGANTSSLLLPAPLPLVATQNGREVKPVPAAGAGAATDIKVDSLPAGDYHKKFFEAVKGRRLAEIGNMLKVATPEQMDAIRTVFIWAAKTGRSDYVLSVATPKQRDVLLRTDNYAAFAWRAINGHSVGYMLRIATSEQMDAMLEGLAYIHSALREPIIPVIAAAKAVPSFGYGVNTSSLLLPAAPLPLVATPAPLASVSSSKKAATQSSTALQKQSCQRFNWVIGGIIGLAMIVEAVMYAYQETPAFNKNFVDAIVDGIVELKLFK